MPTPQRLPKVNQDDGVWGDILRQYLAKEHTNDDTDNPVNGGHQHITLIASTGAAGTAPINFTSGTILTTPVAGALEYDGNFRMTLSGNARTTIVGTDATQTLTNKTLTGPRVDAIKDTNGANALAINATASAVNYMTLYNSAATGAPFLAATGSDTNISLYLNPKGAGGIGIYVATGMTPLIAADGADANHNLNLIPKGTGKVQASGVEVATISATQTLTNKRVTPRVVSVTSAATPAINTDNGDHFNLTALATAVTSMTTNLTGTPTDGQRIMIRIKDNGTARAITWGASFLSSGSATLLTTTSVNMTHHIGFIWDAAKSAWICLAVDTVGY